jgi:hypothetical protein
MAQGNDGEQRAGASGSTSQRQILIDEDHQTASARAESKRSCDPSGHKNRGVGVVMDESHRLH